MKITKRLNGALGGFLLASFCMGCVNSKTCLKNEDSYWMLSDSVVHKQLDCSLTDILFSPNSVKCYYIVYKDSIKNDEVQVINGYVRDSLLTDLSRGQTAVLQFVLTSNSSNYFDDTIKVQSPYIPCLEFEFKKNNSRSASVLISISDHSWQIVQNGRIQSSHNYVETKSMERFCKYFIEQYFNKKGETK